MADENKGVTRREFLQSSAIVGAGALALSACSSSVVRAVASLGDGDFEYIVIGSGAGGGPVACRLARAGKRVLLLEAGGHAPNLNSQVPAFHPLASEDPKMAWNFFVEHYSDPARQARDPKRVPGKGVLYPRAATLGGCTAHNAMIALYPDNRDWNDIARRTNDSSWNSDAMRTYFERLGRTNYVDANRFDLGRHGRDGWLNLEQSDPKMLLSDERLGALALAALKTSGVGEELFNKILVQSGNFAFDPNDWENITTGKPNGIFNIPKSTLKGRRSGVRQFILDTMRDFPGNLHLKSNCLVSKLLFDPNDPKRAIGVEYFEGSNLYRADPSATSGTGGVRKQALARREVILSGGAFNSPQLLLLSGIGPSDELNRHGIPVRVNLPGVGQNLQDRYELTVVTKLNDELRGLRACAVGHPNDPCLAEYQANPEASIYASNGLIVSAIRRSDPKSSMDPDLCIFGVAGAFQGYQPGYSAGAYKKDHFTWAVLKGHTRNTAGYVRLKSKDPFDTPEINFKYFEEGNDVGGDDLKSIVQGLRYARSIGKNITAKPFTRGEVHPGPAVTNDKLEQFARDNAWGHHASCSNKMGDVDDDTAVVDSRFRVRGIQNLRIVDASVFPRIPGLFIAVPIYMIAEKASDEILKDAANG